MENITEVQVQLNAEALELFDKYHKFTGVSPEFYINQLVEKTLPTVKAMVDAMEEASASPDENIDVMELFGRKMAENALQQRQTATEQPLTV